MGKFEQEAKDLLQAIGGKENVTAVTHCATRMRFVLRDDKKANVKAIESIPAVSGNLYSDYSSLDCWWIDPRFP